MDPAIRVHLYNYVELETCSQVKSFLNTQCLIVSKATVHKRIAVHSVKTSLYIHSFLLFPGQNQRKEVYYNTLAHVFNNWRFLQVTIMRIDSTENTSHTSYSNIVAVPKEHNHSSFLFKLGTNPQLDVSFNNIHQLKVAIPQNESLSNLVILCFENIPAG